VEAADRASVTNPLLRRDDKSAGHSIEFFAVSSRAAERAPQIAESY
jgi:hypothetical protein